MSDILDNHQKAGKYINVDGLNIFTRDEGEGETIVLLHGLFSTSFSFRKIIPELKKKYRVIAPDLPGIGFSEKSIEKYSHRMLAKFLFSYLNEISDTRIHLVTYDYGSTIAFLLLNEHPEKIKSLTVISPFTDLDKLWKYFPLFIFNKKWIGNLLSGLMNRGLVRFLYNFYFLDKDAKLSIEEADDYHFLLFRRESRKNFLKMAQNIDRSIYAKKDMESGMQKMIGGRQIIVGESDSCISFRETENIKQYFRTGFAQMIKGGRMLIENSPEECITKIDSLVKVFSRK
jgi:pimeloyl-ACP methyl ester carboxylesterase